MTRSLPIRVLCCSIALIILPVYSDPDALQDICVADYKGLVSVDGYPCKPADQITSADFFFNGFTKEGNTSNMFGWAATPANVLTFPALNTLGIAMNRVDIAPGGLNPPHFHPRASETGVVIQGTLLVGFVTTNNVYHSKTMGPGEMFVVPRGLVHFQQNVGNEKALLYTAFNSQLPGSSIASKNIFGSTPKIPDEVLTKAFQVEGHMIGTIKSKFES